MSLCFVVPSWFSCIIISSTMTSTNGSLRKVKFLKVLSTSGFVAVSHSPSLTECNFTNGNGSLTQCAAVTTYLQAE